MVWAICHTSKGLITVLISTTATSFQGQDLYPLGQEWLLLHTVLSAASYIRKFLADMALISCHFSMQVDSASVSSVRHLKLHLSCA